MNEPNADRVKLEKHETPFPENEVTVWMVVLPSTEVTKSSTKKYTATVKEI